MDATPQTGPAAGRAAGELVVQNGRRSGARRPLTGPVTVIGRAPGCDLRLDADGVAPTHCLLVAGPDGAVLRDLLDPPGTAVNGQPVTQAALRDGDLVTVGPFQFRYRRPAPPAETEPAGEVAAVRIQVAAVAAQQAALDEEEFRLAQRRNDLERQEEQLAAHLEEQRRQLHEQGERAGQERAAWQADRAALEAAVAAERGDLARAQEELARDQQQLVAERQRVARVHQRLRQRWQRLRTGERTALDRGRQELTAREAAAARELTRLNTERELTTRQLRAGLAEVAAARQRWRRRRSREALALRLRASAVEQAEYRLSQARALLAREVAAWERERADLAKELYGLNSRVVHQRQKIQEQPPHERSLDAPRLAGTPLIARDGPPADGPADRLAALDRLAGELADQRAELAEQWERLAQSAAAWADRRDAVAAELEQRAHALAAQEQHLAAREASAAGAEREARRQQDALAGLRQEVQLWRGRLSLRERGLDQERQQLLAAVDQRAAWVDRQLGELSGLRERWAGERAAELSRIEAERAELEQQRLALAREAERPGATPAKWQAQVAAVSARHAALARRADALARAEAAVRERQHALDHQAALLDVRRSRMEQERRQAEQDRRRTEQRLRQLQDEVDRMARTLLDDGEPLILPLDRAA